MKMENAIASLMLLVIYVLNVPQDILSFPNVTSVPQNLMAFRIVNLVVATEEDLWIIPATLALENVHAFPMLLVTNVTNVALDFSAFQIAKVHLLQY